MATAQATDKNPGELKDVPGWFPPLDQTLFTWFLERQETRGFGGDLVELGAYLGKSAILLGHHRQDGEEFTVCDLFGGEAPDGANRAETAKSYSSLTRQAFERNYLAFHDNLPTVIEAPTSVISKEVGADSCRFVHIDASHLYEHVHDDIRRGPRPAAPRRHRRPRRLPLRAHSRCSGRHLGGGAQPRTASHLPEHPEAVRHLGDPSPSRKSCSTMLRDRTDVGLSIQEAAGHRLVRTRAHKGMQSPPFPHSRYHTGPERPKPSTPAAHAPAATPRRPRSRARRIGVDLLPPIVTRALRRALASDAQGAPGRAAAPGRATR